MVTGNPAEVRERTAACRDAIPLHGARVGVDHVSEGPRRVERDRAQSGPDAEGGPVDLGGGAARVVDREHPDASEIGRHESVLLRRVGVALRVRRVRLRVALAVRVRRRRVAGHRRIRIVGRRAIPPVARCVSGQRHRRVGDRGIGRRRAGVTGDFAIGGSGIRRARTARHGGERAADRQEGDGGSKRHGGALEGHDPLLRGTGCLVSRQPRSPNSDLASLCLDAAWTHAAARRPGNATVLASRGGGEVEDLRESKSSEHSRRRAERTARARARLLRAARVGRRSGRARGRRPGGPD